MSNRSDLLKAISEKNVSRSTLLKTGEILRGLTDQQKEIKAGQMLTMLNESKTEKEFLSKMEL